LKRTARIERFRRKKTTKKHRENLEKQQVLGRKIH